MRYLDALWCRLWGHRMGEDGQCLRCERGYEAPDAEWLLSEVQRRRRGPAKVIDLAEWRRQKAEAPQADAYGEDEDGAWFH
jgi:hypothetical protein